MLRCGTGVARSISGSPAAKGGVSYKDFARNADATKTLEQAIPPDVSLTPVREWKALGTPASRPNGREIVTGEHKYPSDVMRPGMLYGKVLRAPTSARN